MNDYQRPHSPFEDSASDRLRRMGLTAADGSPERDAMAVLNDIIAFDLKEEQAAWLDQVNAHVEIVCSDFFFETMPPIGALISIVIVPEV